MPIATFPAQTQPGTDSRFAGKTGGQFERATSTPADAQPARRQLLVHRHHAPLGVDEHHVDRVSHAKGMDRAARLDPQTPTSNQRWSPDKPTQPAEKGRGYAHLDGPFEWIGMALANAVLG